MTQVVTKDKAQKSSNSEIENIFNKARLFVSETDKIIKKRFTEGFSSKEKNDNSLVTEVDLEIESYLRKRISEEFPEHGIIGEEHQASNPGSTFQWILDPIDGTQSFVHGVPTFGTLLAVQREDQNIAGIISHPMLSERYAAAIGLGCYCNDSKIQIKDQPTDKIDPNEIITICSRKQWELTNQRADFDRFWDKHSFFRIYYDCFALSRAVAGQVGCAVEMNVNLWDIAPCQVMVKEAGGAYIDLGKTTLTDGKNLYSALFGKKSVVRFVKDWFQ